MSVCYNILQSTVESPFNGSLGVNMELTFKHLENNQHLSIDEGPRRRNKMAED